MLIDTHCHINIMVKKDFDRLLTQPEIDASQEIVSSAHKHDVTTIINVGTSLVESVNCIALAKKNNSVFAAIGIHPNDATATWMKDFQQLKKYAAQKAIHKIVAIGECGIDKHYPDYNMQRQKDAFKAQIELALENNLALIVHTRDAADETLRSLEEYKNQITRGVIHCFSEDASFAQTVIEWNFFIGIGGTITYPKNLGLRTIVAQTPLSHIVLETDAPFLPPQHMRGKQNTPAAIKDIAHYIAELRQEPFETVAEQTTSNARKLFALE